MHVENGKIRDTMLGIEDHGIMTCWLSLDFSSAGQGFGGYAMDSFSREQKGRIGDGKSIMAIRKILETVGVEKWEDLKGKYVRVKRSTAFGKIDAIGHIVEEKWFSFEEHYKDVQANS